MPTYAYTGRDAKGILIKGTLRADSPEAVALHLSKKNISPININLSSNRLHFTLKELAKIDIGSGKPTATEMITLSRNIGVMLDAGIPLIKTLRELAKTSNARGLKNALFSIADTIHSGKTLELTLRDYPNLFSSLYVSIIAVGENTGNLAEAFTKLGKYLEMEEENKKKLRNALRYPQFVVIAILFATIIINLMVIPSFKKLFGSFSIQLPLPTRILMASSDFMIQNWYIIICFFILIVMGIKALLKIPKFRFIWDRTKLSSPIIGSLINKIMLTRFIWSFSLMLKSGAPMLESLQLVAASTGNQFIQSKIYAIKKNVENGKSLSESIHQVNILTSIDMQMLIAGEESGKLDEMLEKIALEYDKQTEYELKRFGDYIEPILLLFMGVMVGILALAVFLPMWDMGKIAGK